MFIWYNVYSENCFSEMEREFDKPLLMTKKDYEEFEKFIKCWICINPFKKDDVKVNVHDHITGKYWGSANQDCIIYYYNLRNSSSVS